MIINNIKYKLKNATRDYSGLMSPEDKTKLDSLTNDNSQNAEVNQSILKMIGSLEDLRVMQPRANIVEALNSLQRQIDQIMINKDNDGDDIIIITPGISDSENPGSERKDEDDDILDLGGDTKDEEEMPDLSDSENPGSERKDEDDDILDLGGGTSSDDEDFSDLSDSTSSGSERGDSNYERAMTYSTTPSSPNVILETNTVYCFNITQDTLFILPEITNPHQKNEIIIYCHVNAHPEISWQGEYAFYNAERPDYIDGYYDILLNYNPLIGKWQIGAIESAVI